MQQLWAVVQVLVQIAILAITMCQPALRQPPLKV